MSTNPLQGTSQHFYHHQDNNNSAYQTKKTSGLNQTSNNRSARSQIQAGLIPMNNMASQLAQQQIALGNQRKINLMGKGGQQPNIQEMQPAMQNPHSPNQIRPLNLKPNTQQIYFTNTQNTQQQDVLKKGRRLRKNFDMLAQAMKTNTQFINSAKIQTHKQGGEISRNTAYGPQGFQGLTQVLPQSSILEPSNQVSTIPSVYSQVQIVQNINQRNASQSAHNNNHNDSTQLLSSAYGSTHQQVKETRKGGSQASSGYYDILVNKQKMFYSQSQRGASSSSASQKSNLNLIYHGVNSLQPVGNVNHNNSLYSQISLKDQSPNKNKGGLNMVPSRNPSMLMGMQIPGQIQNIQHQTQQISLAHHQTQGVGVDNLFQKQQFLKTNIGGVMKNDKLPRQLLQLGGVSSSSSRKSNENIMLHPNLVSTQPENPSQAILNINTASDINIYNNSFIVNAPIATTGKKQSNSQNPSRSNSIKRNHGGIAQIRPNGANPLNKNTYGVGLPVGNGISLQNLLGMNTDYSNRNNMNLQPSVHSKPQQQRVNSNPRLSSTSQTENQARANQITEAYTATNFFSQMHPQQQPIANTTGVIQPQTLRSATTAKKMIKVQSNKKPQMHSKQQSTSSQAILSSTNIAQIQNLLHQQQLQHQQQQSYNQSFDQMIPSHLSQTDIHNSLNKSANKLNKFASNNFSQSSVLNNGKKRKNSSQQRLVQDSSGDFSSYKNNQNSNNQLIIANQKSQNLTLIGKKRVMEKDYSKAIQLFTEAISLDQQNQDAKFYLALSYLDSGQLQESIQQLNLIVQGTNKGNQNHPTCHILLSIAYNRVHDSAKALQVLSACIDSHPQYPEAYQARGQALLLQDQFSQALQDFTYFTQLVGNSGMGFMGIGDACKGLKRWKEAVDAYTKAIELFRKIVADDAQSKLMKRVSLVQAQLKRGLAYYHAQMYQQSTQDLQAVLKQDATQIKAHFYVGKIMSKQYLGEPPQSGDTGKKSHRPPPGAGDQKVQNEAILHFEQVVKYHKESGEVYAGNALFEISKLRLHDKDFYEAYFNLKRAVDSNFNSKRLQLYKDFTEGVLYLIKRKIKKGVQILSDLLEVLVNSKNKKDQRQLDYLKHQSYIYRAYGYVAIEKYEVALQDIKRAKKIAKLDAATVYNKLLGKGILRMDHEDYIMATKYFTKAALKFNTNKDPYCLHIISMVRSYSYSHQDQCIDQPDKLALVEKATEFMTFAITNCNQKIKVPSLYFFRGLLYFQRHMFYQALQDFNEAIALEEEPTASYYLGRGRVYACLSILTEAMKDLSIALNLDETLQEAYIYRGKCAYLLGDNNLAFLDFQRLILTDPKNPMVHVYAGNLLMTTGAYQDAIKAFQNADTVQKTAVAAFQRARCYCALTDLENAKIHFKLATQLCKTESLIQIDSQILSSLMRVINASSVIGQNSSQSQENTQRAQKNIESAIQIINQMIETFQSEKIKSFRKRDSPLNIQIIPNVKRIKVEKVAVARELYLKAQQVAQNNPNGQDKSIPDITIGTEELMGQPSIDLDALKDLPLHSYYYENVFSLEDLFLFRAIYHFYAKDYLKAIEDYLKCQQIKYEGTDKAKCTMNQGATSNTPQRYHHPTPANNNDHVAESIMAYSQASTPMLSMNSSKTDLSDVGLCSLNVHETNYNIMICYILMREEKKALEKINEIIREAPGKYQKHFFILRGLLYEATGQNDKALKDYAKYEKQEPKSFDAFFKEGKDLVFEPFPIKSRLCSKFENVVIKHLVPQALKNTQMRPKILLRPSFSMPFIKPPNMIPNIDEESIQNEFTLKQIDAPMPEAPWIRRWGNQNQDDPGNSNAGGIKFTDNMLMQEEEDEIPQEAQETQAPKKAKKSGRQLSQDQVKSNRNGQKEQTNQLQPSQMDESPYTHSIDVNLPSKPIIHPTNHRTGLTEQFIRTNNHPSKGQTHDTALMVYQFVGDVLDDDALSDKHKISLFDDSRYEGLGGNSLAQHTLDDATIGGASIEPATGGKQRILGKGREDPLAAGDSLYDEKLLNEVEKQGPYGNEYDSEDEDSSSSENSESDDEEVKESQDNPIRDSKMNMMDSRKASHAVDNSTVILGENPVFGKKKKVQKVKKIRKRPINLIQSTDQDQSQIVERQRTKTQEQNNEENDDDEQRESIFRSRQSTKR